ncbi:MAG: hypothetical protein ACYCYK_03750 [Candidatus Dormibacteria bacterium]
MSPAAGASTGPVPAQPQPAAAAGGGDLRVEIGPGTLAVLLPPSRLGAAQEAFQAAGGEGPLGGDGGALLLLRSGGTGVPAGLESLDALTLTAGRWSWDLGLVHAVGWEESALPGAALLTLDRERARPTVAAEVGLWAPPGDRVATLPVSWARALGGGTEPGEGQP